MFIVQGLLAEAGDLEDIASEDLNDHEAKDCEHKANDGVGNVFFTHADSAWIAA